METLDWKVSKCGSCGGTGEGFIEGSRCGTCNGHGWQRWCWDGDTFDSEPTGEPAQLEAFDEI